MYIAETLRRGRAPFAPSELPECDAFERVALCSRLLRLEALCDARAVGERLARPLPDVANRAAGAV